MSKDYCTECEKQVETVVYNDKVKPTLMSCSECGQFIYQVKEDENKK